MLEPGKNIYFSIYPSPTLIHLSHRFTSASKSAPQKSFDCCLSHFRTFVLTSSSSAKHLPPSWNRVTRQSLRNTNRKHFFMNILCIEFLCLQNKTNNRTPLFDSTLFKHGRHFGYWKQLLNMHICVCYLDCHEVGLCCYLVIYIENLLRPLQLFYFHFVTYLLTLPRILVLILMSPR
jgi:hypothetical protein